MRYPLLMDPNRPAPFELLAFDLDGTLLDRQGQWASGVPELLQAAQARGIHCVAATGRRRFSALPLLRRIGLQGWCVVHNGAVVAEIASGRSCVVRYLQPAAVEGVIAALRARALAPVVYQDVEEGRGEFLVQRGLADASGFLERYLEYASGHFTEVAELGAGPGERVVRITAHHRERAPLEEIRRELEGGERLGLRSFVGFDAMFAVHRLEFLHPLADKWTGLCWVAAQRQVSPERILAVGDDANDQEMLQRAGWSLAAPGAAAIARQAAREPLQGDGAQSILAALRRLLGIETGSP